MASNNVMAVSRTMRMRPAARVPATASTGPRRPRTREFNGEDDHVHLLVHYPPKVALSKLVNSLKGVSSRYLRAEYTGRINRTGTGSMLWSSSYFVGSCGGAPLSIVQEYIGNQKRPA